jgi:hypothetical protein
MRGTVKNERHGVVSGCFFAVVHQLRVEERFQACDYTPQKAPTFNLKLGTFPLFEAFSSEKEGCKKLLSATVNKTGSFPQF